MFFTDELKLIWSNSYAEILVGEQMSASKRDILLFYSVCDVLIWSQSDW